MKDVKPSYLFGFLLAAGISVALAAANLGAQSAADSVDAHVAAARAAAGKDHTQVFNDLCSPPAPAPAQPPQQAAAPRPQGPPPQSAWHVEPAKVFDNLYYLGQSEYSA